MPPICLEGRRNSWVGCGRRDALLNVFHIRSWLILKQLEDISTRRINCPLSLQSRGRSESNHRRPAPCRKVEHPNLWIASFLRKKP